MALCKICGVVPLFIENIPNRKGRDSGSIQWLGDPPHHSLRRGGKDRSPFQLVESDIPVVSIDRIYHGRTAIVSDNVGSMEEIVDYLHQRGHTRIAFIHGEDGDVTRQRLAGFYRGCTAFGVEPPDEYVIPARYHELKDSGQAVQRLMALKKPPTCILFPDDICYLGGFTALEGMGLSVPKDVSCFGYDGLYHQQIARFRRKPFTATGKFAPAMHHIMSSHSLCQCIGTSRKQRGISHS